MVEVPIKRGTAHRLGLALPPRHRARPSSTPFPDVDLRPIQEAVARLAAAWPPKWGEDTP